MDTLEEDVVEAMARLNEKVGGCDPHMFVFPVTEHTVSAFTLQGVELHRDGPVMLICRPNDGDRD